MTSKKKLNQQNEIIKTLREQMILLNRKQKESNDQAEGRLIDISKRLEHESMKMDKMVTNSTKSIELFKESQGNQLKGYKKEINDRLDATEKMLSSMNDKIGDKLNTIISSMSIQKKRR